jgi:hypothetical protein
MFLDFRIDQLPKVRPEASVSALLIRTHETRIARHISAENGGRPAFDALRGQSGAPKPLGRMGYRLWTANLMVNRRAGISFR